MPEYLFEHPETKEVKSIIQKMSEPHIYEENGVKWLRIFTIPNSAVDSVNIDPFSKKDFMKVTNKKDTIGAMMDRSKEMSMKREDKLGHSDPVKEKMYNDYYNKTKGSVHPQKRKEKLEKLKEGISLKLKK